MYLRINQICTLAIALAIFALTNSPLAHGQNGKWIWSPEQDAFKTKSGTCYFRKTFQVGPVDQAQMFIAANGSFQIYINGSSVGQGSGGEQLTEIDLKPYLFSGTNLIAVEVNVQDGPPAGMLAAIRWIDRGAKQWQYTATDSSWKTSLSARAFWVRGFYSDHNWPAAKEIKDGFGAGPEPTKAEVETVSTDDDKNAKRAVSASLSDSDPTTGFNAPKRNQSDTASNKTADKRTNVAQVPTVTQESDASTAANDSTTVPNPPPIVADRNATSQKTNVTQNGKFTVAEEFKVELIADKSFGSLIAMTFDEFGRIIASREGGPLIIYDPETPGIPSAEVYCDKVESCQGILALNGEVYVTGMGEQGMGLYHLVDKDRDGVLEQVKLLAQFTGQPGEHGAHGLTLGPDGMLYVVIGNGSQIKGDIASTSPYIIQEDVDMVPRYEDPGGHATGVRAPGGTIVRISLDGKVKEIVAGGLRNAYDVVFDKTGELFVHDSDMESEEGMKWYRQTRLYHVVPGADFGWRSGWAKYPDYYPDNIAPVARTGRGSPTGAECYNHIMFPLRYHNCLFLGDWSEGKIWSVKLIPDGSGFKTKADTFLSAETLNVTDIAIGPDGAIYFCTGGRGTDGAIYRVSWRGIVPEKYTKMKDDQDKISRQPQFHSAWARQQLAKLQIGMEQNWDRTLRQMIKDNDLKSDYRLRALETMALYGPVPDTVTLSLLADDKNELIRAKVTAMLGMLEPDEAELILKKMLSDESAIVRRQACHALTRLNSKIKLQDIERNLISVDKNEAWAARRLLFAQPAENWKSEILDSDNPRLFVQGALALIEKEPTIDNAYSVLVKVTKLLDGHLDESLLNDVLRVTQVSLARCKVDADKIPAFTEKLATKFPHEKGDINCELAGLLAYLKSQGMGPKVKEYIETSNNERPDKIKVAMTFVTLAKGFTGDEKIALIKYLEQSKTAPGGGSYKAFLGKASEEIAQTIGRAEALVVLRNADKWPSAAVQSLYIVYQSIDDQATSVLIEADLKLSDLESTDYDQLKSGIIAVLSKGGEDAEKHLREIWRSQPKRKNDVVLALAQQPGGENWNYLVASLGQMNDNSSKDVLAALTTINRRPKNPKYYREVIMIGQRLGEEGAHVAVNLLEHWSAQKITVETDPWQMRLEAWKKWFREKYPEQPVIELYEPGSSKLNIDEIIDEFTANGGSVAKGQMAFAEANCVKCHRYGPVGEAMGPDLTTIANRFSTREILESILFPSKVISDQYAAKTVLTIDGKTHTGIVTTNRDQSLTVLTNEGKKISIAQDEIDEVSSTHVSAMPDDTLDTLDKKDVADLLAYLKSGRVDTAQSQQSTNR